MARYYVHNLETDKLNIFTGGKSDWLSIPEADRDRIKSACLWSRSIGGWVSRAKGGKARFYAIDVLDRNGFEDRGAEGERRSFAEQVEAQQQRAEARAERFEDRASAAEDNAQALYNRAHTMADAIPFGQPILVGHHSERRDRNYRDRIHNTFGKAFAEADKAKHYADRATTARATADGAKFSDPAYLSARIKECEAELRVIENRLQGKFYAHSEPKAISDEYRGRLEDWKADFTDKLDFHKACLDSCVESGVRIFDKESLKGKTEVLIRGRWERVVRLNTTTVSVYNICFPSEESQRKWPLKYPYAQVKDAR